MGISEEKYEKTRENSGKIMFNFLGIDILRFAPSLNAQWTNMAVLIKIQPFNI